MRLMYLLYHKAKGLEFDIVFCLEAYRFVMPPYRGVQKDIEQSLGMHYVGITRAKKACYIALGLNVTTKTVYEMLSHRSF